MEGEKGNPGNAFANQSNPPPPLARRCARQFKRTVRLSSLSHFFSHLPLSRLFGPSFPSSSSTSPGPCNPIVGAEPRLVQGEGKAEERERETRENPLRNVFGPCAARYYLQSRAYIKYTRREEKGHDEKRERESFSERPRYENAHDDEPRTKSGGRLIFKFSLDLITRLAYSVSVCLPSSFFAMNMYSRGIRRLSRNGYIRSEGGQILCGGSVVISRQDLLFERAYRYIKGT